MQNNAVSRKGIVILQMFHSGVANKKLETRSQEQDKKEKQKK